MSPELFGLFFILHKLAGDVSDEGLPAGEGLPSTCPLESSFFDDKQK